MATKVYSVLLLFRTWLQVAFAGLDTLRPLPTRQLDSVRVSRLDLERYEAAAAALLLVDYGVADSLISSWQVQTMTCEEALARLSQLNEKKLTQLVDTLGRLERTLDRARLKIYRATARSDGLARALPAVQHRIKLARRRVWIERAGAFLLGVATGVLLPSIVK
jgi:uncharacterized protein HemX